MRAGEQGLGYYRDMPSAASAEEPKEGVPKPAAKPKAIGLNNSIVKGLALKPGIAKKKKKTTGDLRAPIETGAACGVPPGAPVPRFTERLNICQPFAVLRTGRSHMLGATHVPWRLTAGSSVLFVA